MNVILLTGFLPMEEGNLNSSCEVVKCINGQEIDGCKIESITVPVTYGKDIDEIAKRIQMVKPRAILSLGESPSTALSVERIAINLKSIEIQDSYGNERWDCAVIIEDAPAAYVATIPVRKVVDAILEAGIPDRVSCYAGTNLCNHIMYNVLHYISQRRLDIIAGFIHVPMLPQQVVKSISHRPGPSMSLDNIVCGVKAAIKTIIGEFKSMR